MKEKTTEDFIHEAQEIHGDTYDYSRSSYQGALTKVDIICPLHGTFSQTANSHLRGAGCPECGHYSRKKKKGSSRENFIRKSRDKHGDRFDYSSTNYVNARTKVTIICPEHGKFSQLPSSHVRGFNGCTGCNGQQPISREEFLSRSIELHGSSFDYSFVGEELSHHRKVTLRCIKHDREFKQEISSHLRGYTGCPLCRTKLPLTIPEIQEKSFSVYGERYDFSRVNIHAGSNGMNTIGCHVQDHGFFSQSLSGHLSGRNGCRKCDKRGMSRMEEELAENIRSLGVEMELRNRTILSGRELDIYIPEKSIAVEFNGIYWHSDQFLDKEYHYRKWRDCHDQDVQLITIWEDDWLNKRELVMSMLKHKLGMSSNDSVYARTTEVREVPYLSASRFLVQRHIQGDTTGSMYIGLYHSDDLVAVSVWRKISDVLYLDRYATSMTVVGGMGKLLKAGIRYAQEHGCTKIVTFADHEVSDGGLYEKLGFTLDKELKPDYRYVIDNQRVHKFNYRLKRFRDDPELVFQPGLTEKELADINDIRRIWDCGKSRYIFDVS